VCADVPLAPVWPPVRTHGVDGDDSLVVRPPAHLPFIALHDAETDQ